jgi:hypothetical protein
MIALALLFTSILAHGLLIPWLGFYWDDWPTVWFLNRFGSSVYSAAYGVDRPALGWLFTVTTTLIGQSALAWQIFGILTRWAACLSLWAMLRAVWPLRKIETAWVAFLFAIYPGFRQHPIALTYSADWIAICLFFLSFWLMLKAVRQLSSPEAPKMSRLWPAVLLVFSWLLAGYVMFADEYYFGLEFLRPIFLWLVLAENLYTPISSSPKRRLARVILFWLPYLALMGLFLFWRLVVFVSPRGQLTVFDQFIGQPVAASLALAIKILKDLFKSGILAWTQIVGLNTIKSSLGSARLMAAYLGLTVLAIGIAIVYFRIIQRPDSTHSMPSAQPDERKAQKKWAIQAVFIGVFALFVGGWPFWVTDLPIELYFPWDRFTLAMMFGACLALAGAIVFAARTPLLKAISFGLICGLAIGFHFYNANLYRQDWSRQKDFFWQLSWRIPALEPGTLVLTNDLPLKYFSDNSLTAPLNLIYDPQNHSRQMNYMIYNIDSRLGLGLTALESGLPIEQAYRIASFSGNTSKMVVLFAAPSRCIKVIDPATDALLPHKPAYIDEATPLSNLDLIKVDPSNQAQPPRQFFGDEPDIGWCYYFQKADLARQQQDWAEVARLGDLAQAQPIHYGHAQGNESKSLFALADPSELIPFIQGYAQIGEWGKAIEFTKQAFEDEPKIANMICPIWYDLYQTRPSDSAAESEAQKAFRQVSEALNCAF